LLFHTNKEATKHAASSLAKELGEMVKERLKTLSTIQPLLACFGNATGIRAGKEWEADGEIMIHGHYYLITRVFLTVVG
jgi:hypothetical protein